MPHGQIWLMKTHGISEFPQKDDSIETCIFLTKIEDLPAERLHFMLKDADVQIVLSNRLVEVDSSPA